MKMIQLSRAHSIRMNAIIRSNRMAILVPVVFVLPFFAMFTLMLNEMNEINYVAHHKCHDAILMPFHSISDE